MNAVYTCIGTLWFVGFLFTSGFIFYMLRDSKMDWLDKFSFGISMVGFWPVFIGAICAFLVEEIGDKLCG